MTVDGAAIEVMVADDSAERRQGLRGMEELPSPTEGMLFVFDRAAPVTFTMMDTLIPLDIWFFGEDGELLGTLEMEPCRAEPCPLYRSPGPVAYALETPRGRFDFEAGAMISTVEND